MRSLSLVTTVLLFAAACAGRNRGVLGGRPDGALRDPDHGRFSDPGVREIPDLPARSTPITDRVRSSDLPGTRGSFDQGCGNTHYAPNSRNSYDMHHGHVVLTRCEHYGLQDGPDGKDIQTPYSYATIEKLMKKYGDDGNGGGWQVYLLQNFPNHKTKAKLPDGTRIKNFWPYLYY